MLVELQISIAEIQRANNQFTMEVEGLRNTIEAQKREMAAMKSSLEKLLNQNQTLEEELYAARGKAEEQEQDIVEVYDLQDNLEQCTRYQEELARNPRYSGTSLQVDRGGNS